jgi:hypothetical protein
MSPLERLRANPLPFAEHLRIEFVSAELDRIVAKCLSGRSTALWAGEFTAAR